jgi:hypothetical protein
MEYSYNLDFQKIRKITQVEDIQSLEFYLTNIFNDLVSRENNQKDEKTIEKITFIEYMNIPFIVGEKIFKVFNKSKNGFLNKKEFVSGIISLYSGSLEETEEMIFNLLDFDLDGIIIPEDARLLLTFLKNLAVTSTKNITLKNINININTYTDEEEFKSIDNFVNSFFKGKQSLTFEQFKVYIEEENSDLFLLFMYFLYNNKPFQNYSIKFLKLRNNINDFSSIGKIQSDINNSIDIRISENNIKKTLISPSKSFKDIVEDITYIDIEELSNCSDLENLVDLDDLTFSTLENVRINTIPKLNPNISFFSKKNENDYLRRSTKNILIFGSNKITQSKELFQKRLSKNNSFYFEFPKDKISRKSSIKSIEENNESNDNNDDSSNVNINFMKKKSNFLNKDYTYKNTFTENKFISSDENRESENNSKINKKNENNIFRVSSHQLTNSKIEENLNLKKETVGINRCTTDLSIYKKNLPKIEIFREKAFIEIKNNMKELKDKKKLNLTNIPKLNSSNSLNHLSPLSNRISYLNKDEDCIEFESYLYRAEDNNQLKKYFTALIGYDLYYFSNSKKVRLKGIHNLSGTYVFKDKNTIKVRKEKSTKFSKFN